MIKSIGLLILGLVVYLFAPSIAAILGIGMVILFILTVLSVILGGLVGLGKKIV